MAHTKSRHKLERERREAFNEIERIEGPERMKSERDAKLLGRCVERSRHPAFTRVVFPNHPGCTDRTAILSWVPLPPVAANVAPSISDGLIATPPYDAGIGNLPDRFCPARGGY